MGLGPMGQGMEMIEEEEELSITSEGTPCLEIWVQRNEDGTFNPPDHAPPPPHDRARRLRPRVSLWRCDQR